MKKVFTINFLLYTIINLSIGQNYSPQPVIRQNINSHQSWITVPDQAEINCISFFEEFRNQLQIPENSEMKFIRMETEPNEWNHYRYQQYYNEIKVYGAEYILHEHHKVLNSANGRIETEINVDSKPDFDTKKAIDLAIQNHPSKHFIWNLDPSLYPEVNLYIIDEAYPNKSGNLRLAYQVDLFSLAPINKIRYFIDAHSGKIILSYNILTTCFAGTGSASTLYRGDRNIETEEVNGSYYLNDLTRGNGISTISSTGKQYSDDNNNWESGSFVQKVGALDLHYGAQTVYDFYKSALNRNGIDGKDGKIICKVIDTIAYVNAFWESSSRTTNFGIGDNVDTGPLTSIDVVGHEMSHGLTEYTCGLEYLFEAGALNEALSDIFGKTIEYKSDSTEFHWLIGEKFFFKPDTAFRSMSDPNRFKNPKAYKGAFWINNSSDNGGVHTNSGVLNFWFYLLVEGQTGLNEFGKDYKVDPMGFDATISLVYQMMKNYMTSTSYYYDAREASLKVAETMYGRCSKEYKNIIEAWKAVGMGSGVNEGDLLLSNNKIPQLSCKEGLFEVEVRLNNQSCDQIIPKNTEIEMSIAVKQKNKIIENYILENDLLPGESVIYKFINPAKIDKTATLVTVEAIMKTDADTSNNRFTISITKNTNSDHDFRINQINVNGSPCENKTVTAQIQATYNGCSPVPANTEMDLVLKYDNEVLVKKIKNNTTLYPGLNFRPAAITIDRNFSGYRKILASLNYSRDTVLTNNNGSFNVVYINNTQLGYLEPFTDFKFDSTLMGIRRDSFQTNAIQNNISGSEAMVFSGGKIFSASDKFLPVNASIFANFISSNVKYTSTIYLCIDTKDLGSAFLSFDYIQKLGNTNYDSLNVQPDFAAGTRVSYRDDRGALIGTPSYIQNASKEGFMRYFEEQIPLTGGPISIEITNISLDGKVDDSGIGIDTSRDYVLLDNINIHAIPISNDDKLNFTFNITPNPFTEILYINCIHPLNGYSYKVYGMLGNDISHGVFNVDQPIINTSKWIPGSYIITISDHKGNVVSDHIVKF